VRWRAKRFANKSQQFIDGPYSVPRFRGFVAFTQYVIFHLSLWIDVHGTWEWLVKKYGPLSRIFIIHQPVLVVADPALVQQIMVKDGRIWRRPVEAFDYLHLMGPAVKGSIPRAEGDEWLLLHRIMHKGFKHDYLRKMTPLIQRYLNQMVDQWQGLAQEGQILHVNFHMSRLTLDIIGRVAFGFEFKALDGSDLVAHAERFMEEITNPLAYMPLYYLLPTPGNNSMRKAMNVLMEKAYAVLRQRAAPASKSEGSDLLYVLLQKDDLTGTRLSESTIVANSIFFMVAGHESTSTALSYMIYLLAEHQEIQDKARLEVNKLFQEKPDPQLDDYLSLKYIEMIVKEGLRLYPPAPFNVRVCTEETSLAEYRVPKNTPVFIPVREVHRLPSVWENPHAFDPDRWLPERAASIPPGAFLPFNLGMHSCIGQKFAMVEMKIILSTLVYHFAFTPVAGFKPELSIHFMRPRRSIQVYARHLPHQQQQTSD
jgi:cytochrome P450